MGKEKKPKGKLRRTLEKLFVGVTLFHASTQITYWANDLYHHLRPSAVRTAFKTEFGIPLHGWSADIEAQPQQIGTIAEVLRTEQREGHLPIDSVRVQSQHYLKQSFLQQLQGIFTTGYSGQFFFPTRAVVLFPSASRSTMHHEVKHAKAYQLLQTHPEFFERWQALTAEFSGNGGYRSLPWRFCARTRGLEFLVREIPSVPTAATDAELDRIIAVLQRIDTGRLRHGFVSAYAQTNIHEDIAEVGELAERDGPVRQILDLRTQYPLIDARFALAEEYGLIARDFSAYTDLQQQAVGVWIDRNSVSPNVAQTYLVQSSAFLSQYPASQHIGEIRSLRGTLLMHLHDYQNPRPLLEAAVREFELALTAPDYDGHYSIVLDRLAACHASLGNRAHVEAYRVAQLRFLAQLRTQSAETARREGLELLRVNGFALPPS